MCPIFLKSVYVDSHLTWLLSTAIDVKSVSSEGLGGILVVL